MRRTCIRSKAMSEDIFADFLVRGVDLCKHEDPVLYELLEKEYRNQMGTLRLVASCSVVDPSVLACEAMPAVNVTAEGYPGKRFHAGCGVIDEIESLAIRRACEIFGARYANVQSHSASSANLAVIFALLNPGDRILGMKLEAGGHLSHGSPVSLSGRYFDVASYGLTPEGMIDYDQVHRLALEFRPRLLICGA